MTDHAATFYANKAATAARIARDSRLAAHHAIAAAAALEQYADACRSLGFDLENREAQREVAALRAAAAIHDRRAASADREQAEATDQSEAAAKARLARESEAVCAFETGR